MLTGEEPEREGLMENDGRTGNDVPRFDPITGEPLNEQQMRFDPQTGRPINAAGAGTPSPQMRFDPQTGRPISAGRQALHSPKKKRKWIIPVCIVAAVVLVLVIAGSVVMANPKVKIARAAMNTFSKSADEITDFSAVTKSKGQGEIGLSVDSSILTADVTLDRVEDDLSAAANVSLPNFGISAVANAYMDDSKAAMQFGEGDGTVYYYDFTKTNDGELLADFLDSAGLTQEELNKILQSVNGKKISDTTNKVEDIIKNLEIDEIDPEEVTINGKEVNCQGYEIVLDRDEALQYAEEIFSLYMDSDEAESFAEYVLDDVYSSDDSEYTLDIFLNRNTIAALRLEEDGYGCYVEFAGGDFPLQNINVYWTDDTKTPFCNVSGWTDGNVLTEQLNFYSDGSFQPLAEFTYDTDSDSYSLSVQDEYDNATISVTGTLAGTKDNFNITFDTIYVDGIDIISLISEVLPYVLQDGMEDFAGDVGEILNSLSVGVSFSKKANVSRIEVGSDAVDLGAASEDDVEEMSVNILNDLGLSWLLNLYGY